MTGKKKGHRVLKKHFKIFESECQYWLDKLKMSEYELACGVIKTDASNDAECVEQHEHAMAVIGISPYLSIPCTRRNLCECAAHEIFELLLWGLRKIADQRLERETINGEIHKVVQRLMNTVFDEDYNARYPDAPSEVPPIEGNK